VKLTVSKNQLFWILNTSGWFAFAVTWFIFYGPQHVDVRSFVKFFIGNFLLGYLISFGLRYFFRKFDRRENSITRLSLVIIFYSFIGAAVWYYIDVLSTFLIYDVETTSEWISSLTWTIMFRTIVRISLLLLPWSALYFLINLAFDWQEEKREKEKALLLATKSKMEVLKNQINPHFLFNSLNSVSALIEENPSKALKLVDELSDFLRFTLVNKENSMVTLKDELKLIEHFVHIQSIRFEEKLLVEYRIDPLTEEIFVLASILYPLVENAVKHGMNTSELPLHVKISSQLKNEKLYINIKNSGLWVEPKPFRRNSTNTGLSNVIDRLECEYGSNASLNIEKSDNFVDIQLTFPVKQSE